MKDLLVLALGLLIALIILRFRFVSSMGTTGSAYKWCAAYTAKQDPTWTCPTNYTVSGSTCVANNSNITGLTCDSPNYFTANYASNQCVAI